MPDGEAPVTETGHHESCELSEPSGDADLFDFAAYQQAWAVMKQKRHAGCYDKACEACIVPDGQVKPHRSGPQVESADKVKYTVIGVHRMPNGADYHRSSGFVPIVVYKELQAQKFKEFEI